MARNGAATKTRILDVAQELILDYGFGSTSVDKVIEAAGITKGAFFYHFKTKSDLAQALVDRYAAMDRELYFATAEKAERLARDPYQQLLLFVGLFEEQARELNEPHPGCLFVSYCYENQLYDEQTKDVVLKAMLFWRQQLGDRIKAVMATRKPRLAVDVDSLADMFTVVLEGAFMMGKTLHEARLLADQMRHYRNYLELLFGDAPAVKDDLKKRNERV